MYKIQMPIDSELKGSVEHEGRRIGLKNINDVIRFLLINFTRGRVKFELDKKAKGVGKEEDDGGDDEW